MSAVQVFRNTVGKGEIARNEQFPLFPQFSNRSESSLPFSSILKLSANSFSLDELLKFVVWNRVNSIVNAKFCSLYADFDRNTYEMDSVDLRSDYTYCARIMQSDLGSAASTSNIESHFSITKIMSKTL